MHVIALRVMPQQLNVWTHTASLLYVVLSTPSTLQTVLDRGHWMDKVVFVVFLLSAQACFGAR